MLSGKDDDRKNNAKNRHTAAVIPARTRALDFKFFGGNYCVVPSKSE